MTFWESGELYTCYNRSNLQVIHSLDVAERARKLIVFMEWIRGDYLAIGA
jgi:hypothetical protein